MEKSVHFYVTISLCMPVQMEIGDTNSSYRRPWQCKRNYYVLFNVYTMEGTCIEIFETFDKSNSIDRVMEPFYLARWQRIYSVGFCLFLSSFFCSLNFVFFVVGCCCCCFARFLGRKWFGFYAYWFSLHTFLAFYYDLNQSS